jgi:hypothetical protein
VVCFTKQRLYSFLLLGYTYPSFSRVDVFILIELQSIISSL